MVQPIKLLLVEDDERLARYTHRYFTAHDVMVTHVADGQKAIEEAAQRQYDVVLLDLNLPTVDGFSVCRALRSRSDVPIIMVTARIDESHRVRGLELGADDYVLKPFSIRELLSRARAIVRRARGQAGPPKEIRTIGALTLDAAKLEATVDGRVVGLTAYEFSLLSALADRAGHPVSREHLLDLAKQGGAEEVFDRSIDVRISRLRQKLGDDPRHPAMLKTVRGVGYVLVAGSTTACV